MECRAGCGACCIAPSITSSIPGMRDGKPAGVRCEQLNEENHCLLFDSPDRPAVCASFKACQDICGECFEEAMQHLLVLEKLTSNKI